eukprot:TRINITY_DN19088_c0_g1_i1.p1 TRINITY_DN19088_c0_g1~~TRINITY_DN19088_c0_g1_i1.p1  ORF type:complete len:174 (+),score=10.77 TRINITY_DN19088_c0_g1_i1:123-644(+)
MKYYGCTGIQEVSFALPVRSVYPVTFAKQDDIKFVLLKYLILGLCAYLAFWLVAVLLLNLEFLLYLILNPSVPNYMTFAYFICTFISQFYTVAAGGITAMDPPRKISNRMLFIPTAISLVVSAIFIFALLVKFSFNIVFGIVISVIVQVHIIGLTFAIEMKKLPVYELVRYSD